MRVFNPFKPSGNKHEITMQVVRTFATIVCVTQGGFPFAPFNPFGHPSWLGYPFCFVCAYFKGAFRSPPLTPSGILSLGFTIRLVCATSRGLSVRPLDSFGTHLINPFGVDFANCFLIILSSRFSGRAREGSFCLKSFPLAKNYVSFSASTMPSPKM